MEQAFARHLLEKIPEEEKAALFLLQHTEQSPSALGH
jgi:interferon regulatory factor 9